VEVVKGGAADTAHMKTGDKILSIDGAPIATFDEMRKVVLKHPGAHLNIVVERQGKSLPLLVTPLPKAENGGGQILVQAKAERVPVTFRAAVTKSVIAPAIVVDRLVIGLARIIMRKEKPDLAGPVGIVKIASSAASRGMDEYLEFLGMLSAYLGGFNLLPLPALDGGRLVFLAYEAVTRRRANAQVEAQVHMVGFAMLLALILVVSYFDLHR
jgi:regulator of sigma E protease